MPSPVAHSLVGCLVSRHAFTEDRLRCRRTLACIVAGNLPDLDFVPGALVGQPNLYHHAFSHSIAAGLLASALLAVFFAGGSGLRKNGGFLLFFGLYCSHLFLDYLSVSGRPPSGIPVLWPFSDRYFVSPFPVLPGITHSQLKEATISQVAGAVASMHNLYVILAELSAAFLIHAIIRSLSGLQRRSRVRVNERQ